MAGPKTERRQQHGEESRQRILDATAEIAAERGYDGTSISLVSKRSGLPASSIYWHFQDKDQLLAAVIERSYRLWRDRFYQEYEESGPHPDRATRLHALARAIATSLLDRPEFLRLGLMLTLENRPVEAKGRELFVQIRVETHSMAAAEFQQILTEYIGLPADQRDALAARLATQTLATSDGLFIAYHLRPESFDLTGEFELLATVLDAAIDRWTTKP